MITPTRETLDAFRPDYAHPVFHDEVRRKQRTPRWARVLAVIVALGVVGAVIVRLVR